MWTQMVRLKADTALALLTAFVVSIALAAQSPLEPASLLKMPTDAWPSYHGDYSGRRYSTLTQINSDNVKNLALAWVYRLNTSQALAVIGGEGPDVPPAAANGFGPPTIKATPLMVNGVLYFSSPDHVWAVDARTGREQWHYFWKTRGGIHIGNRGVGMYGNWIYFLTPDNYFVSLEGLLWTLRRRSSTAGHRGWSFRSRGAPSPPSRRCSRRPCSTGRATVAAR